MIRQALSLLVQRLAELLCADHIPFIGTDPIYCARCFKRLT